jgi:hypothetical protein
MARVRTTIVSRRHDRLLGAEESLDKVGHCAEIPQWIAGEDGAWLRPDGSFDVHSANVISCASTNAGGLPWSYPSCEL